MREPGLLTLQLYVFIGRHFIADTLLILHYATSIYLFISLFTLRLLHVTRML